MGMGVLCCLRRCWWRVCGEKNGGEGKVTVWLTSSRFGLSEVIQSIKAIGILLLKVSECSVLQRNRSLAFLLH
jgi:hypothetical protein